jgi:hypothetical protein
MDEFSSSDGSGNGGGRGIAAATGSIWNGGLFAGSSELPVTASDCR